MNQIEIAKRRLQEISKKNETKEYSLGDVLLVEKYEKELFDNGLSNSEIKLLSPSYYKS